MPGKRSFVATGLAAMGLVAMLGGVGVAAASPAMAAEQPLKCQYWNDQHTFGVSCDPNGVTQYQAVARCSNGNWYLGPWVARGWSYVYCSTYYATYVPNTGREQHTFEG
ncbi:hypothetical protein BCF44_1398 [Kutzneria buriramensis]|uniref:Secreted protein n=2 Tax=Kutzneria buriramensis TaxID=1045776 RepID=A0A3E0G6Y9_9PSEU|nr:hypothetical protein BCF44_1398 [Kutzneria buriramensis]